MNHKILKEAKQTKKDLAVTKSLCGSPLTKEELLTISQLTESELLTKFGLDLFMVEKVVSHAKKEQYRLRAQAQFTPEVSGARKSKITNQPLYPQKPYTRTSPITEAVQNDIFNVDQVQAEPLPAEQISLSEIMLNYVGFLKAVASWFHSAHHTTKGTSFSGDHVNLYGRIYSETNGEIDGAVEKGIGLTTDTKIACPVATLSHALSYLSQYPLPTTLDSLGLASTGLQIQRDYISFVENMFSVLDKSGQLSLGLNDFLASTANMHEDHVYLLQQRVTSDLGVVQ